MKVFSRTLACALLTCLYLGLGSALAETDPPSTTNASEGAFSELTMQRIKQRADEIAASSGLDEATQSTLAELYRQAIGSLEAVEASKATAERYGAAIQGSKDDAARFRSELEKQQAQADSADPTVTAQSLADAELQLQEAKARRATVEGQLAKLRSQVQAETERPVEVRRLISEAKSRVVEVESEPAEPVVGEEPAELAQARSWAKRTRVEQLRAETLRLGQELASHPVRMDALQAQLDLVEFQQLAAQAEVNALEAAVNKMRREDTERAKAEARAAEVIAVGKHPLLEELAGRNRKLSEEIDALAAAINDFEEQERLAAADASSIEQNFASTRQKTEVAGVSQILGALLLEQRRNLPDADRLRNLAEARERKIAQTTLSKYVLEEERRALRDIGAYVVAISANTPPEDAEGIAEELDQLVRKRRELVDYALDIHTAHLQALGELDFAQQRLREVVAQFDSFLAERLLWVRSTAVAGPDTARLIPEQIAALLSPEQWRILVRDLLREAASPYIGVVVLLLGLRLARRRLLHMLEESGRNVGNLLHDRLTDTLRALLVVVLLALPWPLLFFIIGKILVMSGNVAEFSNDVGLVLTVMATLLFQLQTLRMIVAPGSVAAVHFGWREKGLARLHKDLRWFTPLVFVSSSVTLLSIYSDNQAWGGGLGRASFLVSMTLFSIFFSRLTSPTGGTLSILFADKQWSRVFRWRHLWFILLVSLPMVAAVVALAGYMYTALTVIGHIVETLWFTLLAVVAHQFIVRWLTLNQRRLRLQAARERRRAEQEARATEADEEDSAGLLSRDVDEPEVDFKALDAVSRRLTDNAFLMVGIIGVWFIWRDMLPALQFLDDITLWTYAKPGVEGLVPITLMSVALALLILLIIIIATRQLPAFLELALLQRLNVSQGSRYTVLTLSKYTIVAVGVAWIFSTLGGSWSEIQWIFAALGVGIGFGLQEIVANFISGLIILFERPIRVGDVVSVGNTDGIVTRIRIRATTIRNWDKHELLVPNKNFITQELLNWTLSDQTTRVMIRVGVAYGSDVDRAMLIMEEAAKSHSRVIADPEPFVVFEEFGDNALLLSLRCYIDDIDYRLRTITELNQAIYRDFNDAGIEISFPQQDVHLDTRRPLDVRVQAMRPDGATE